MGGAGAPGRACPPPPWLRGGGAGDGRLRVPVLAEIRANRLELRQARRESRDVRFEEGAEWTSKAIYYGIAFFLFFSLSWYVVPGLIFS